MTDDDKQALIVLGALYLWSKYSFEAVKPLERAGAKVYDVVHPSERDHADDLPGKRLTKAQIVKLARDCGFPDPNLAAAIAIAESGGYPGSLGDGGTSVGLWQIHMPAWPQYTKDQLRDPLENVEAAWHVSHKGTNWNPWSTFKSGAYKKYL
jgi:hypothetical protein